jgi:peroxiredoxin
MATMLSLFKSRLLVIGAGAGLLALVSALAIAISRDVGQDPLGEVDPSIDQAGMFSLLALDGERVAIADYAGGPVFLYFWASWCAPCEREAPLLEQMWAEYAPQGYTFVGVNILDSERGARDFVERHGLTFPMLLDHDGGVYFEFGVNGVPEAYFLARGLAVEGKYIGELREPEFREMLEGIRGDAVRDGAVRSGS